MIPVSRSTSSSDSEELNHEIYNLDLSSDSVTHIATAALDSGDLSSGEIFEDDSPNLNNDLSKVKASKKYTLGERLKFNVWLPLKGRFCSVEEKRDKALYEKHQALSAGIKKVQRAYQQYIAAEKAVEGLEEGQSVLLNELSKMQKLIDRYNKLIELAVATANGEAFSATDLQLDITEILSDKNIFHTINTVRAKMLWGTALSKDDRREILFGNEGSEEKIKEAYVDFATNIVHHVDEAALAAGAYDEDMIKEISQAFVEGLASIRGEADRISFHAELLKLSDPTEATDEKEEYEAKKDMMRSDVLNSFTRFIQDLIDDDQPITRSDLDTCQHAGICLTSVMEDGDIEMLENLRKSMRSLEDAESELRYFQDLHRETKDELAASNEFSFTEIEEFLSSVVDSKNIVPDAYYQAKDDLAKVDERIQQLKLLISEYTVQLDRANQLVIENQALVTSLEGEGLAKKAAYEAKLRALEQKETKCQAEIERFEHSNRDFEREFGRDAVQAGIQAIERKYQEEKTRLEAEIAAAKNQWDQANAELDKAKEQQVLAIAEQEKLQNASVEIEHIRQYLIECNAKRENTTIKLSGNDLLKLSTIRRIGSIRADNQIITAMETALQSQLSQKEIEEAIQTQEKLVRKLQTESRQAMDANPILNDGFSDRIAREIDSHLEIAEKITDRVNRVISDNNLRIRSLLKENDALLADLDNIDEAMESDEQSESIEDEALSSDIFKRVKMLHVQDQSNPDVSSETDFSFRKEVVFSSDEEV